LTFEEGASSGPSTQPKNLFQTKMFEKKTKCKYTGYCKYKEECKYLHPKEECKENCRIKSCMKRHVKLCKFITNCRHKEKCAYKHFTDKNKINIDYKDKLASLDKTLKELLEYKINSEAKIKSLEKEVKSLKTKSVNENKTQPIKLSGVESLSDEFAKLKSEFALLKLYQKNQITKTADKISGISCKSVKCNACESIFQTKSGLKVHNDIVHHKEPVNKEELKCNHCIITCSDLDVMKKHIVREHRFKCKECNATFKEECNLQAHTNTSHEQIKVTK
jgi:hypothetical protein